MKKILFSLAMLFPTLLPMGASAQGASPEYVEKTTLVVELSDGTQSEYFLEDEPVLTFTDDSIVVTCNNDVVQFAPDNVVDYHFNTRRVSTDIREAPATNDAEPSFSFSNATFSGLKAGTRIMVYTIDGKPVKTITAGQDGTAKIELSSLPRGIYIIRTPNKSFKVTNN